MAMQKRRTPRQMKTVLFLLPIALLVCWRMAFPLTGCVNQLRSSDRELLLSASSVERTNGSHSSDSIQPVLSLSNTFTNRGTPLTDRMKPFCQHWSKADANNLTLRPFDVWYTHHPTWIVTNETEDMFCVEPGDGTQPHVGNLMKIYANQFHSPCNKVHVRNMWSSGWGADFGNMQAGIMQAISDVGGPLVMDVSEHAWHYAANKNDTSNMTCQAVDTTCYFLPYHGCGDLNVLKASNGTEIVGGLDLLIEAEIQQAGLGKYAYAFMTRKMVWTRRAVFDYKQQFKEANDIEPESDCTVVHVRRSDVILHAEATRKYYPVADYVKLIPQDKLNDPNHFIFFLTDDANAIDEAHEFFPELKWNYFDRPRHRGSEGGWENQTPSRNPKLEVIVLLATIELAQECSVFVHGHSNFAKYIYHQMKLSDKHSHIESYRVEGENIHPYNPLHNTSDADLEKKLNEMRIHNNTLSVSHAEKQEQNLDTNTNSTIVGATDDQNCSKGNSGIIVVNMMGRLANNLFELAFAKRMATQLGCNWHVIYRTLWMNAIPNHQTDVCFPNALASNNNRHASSKNQTMEAIQKVNEVTENGTNLELNLLHQALTYNELEPFDGDWDNSNDRATKLVGEWVGHLGDAALNVSHLEYPLQDDNVDQLVLELKKPTSSVRVLNLKAFFIHFDWMRGWMDEISSWLRIDPSCCTTPSPSENAIVIHIRDFDDATTNKHLQVGVYRDIINKYSNNTDNPEVMVVCQHKSVETDIVQALVKEFGAVVQTGNDNIDAFCLLSSAQGLLILSTSSTFSEMAALLAERKNENLQVHYPTHTLDHPKVTLKVSSWKYHLVNQGQVIKFDVDHQRLEVSQA